MYLFKCMYIKNTFMFVIVILVILIFEVLYFWFSIFAHRTISGYNAIHILTKPRQPIAELTIFTLYDKSQRRATWSVWTTPYAECLPVMYVKNTIIRPDLKIRDEVFSWRSSVDFPLLKCGD